MFAGASGPQETFYYPSAMAKRPAACSGRSGAAGGTAGGAVEQAWMQDLQQRLQRPVAKPTNPDQGSASTDAESLV